MAEVSSPLKRQREEDSHVEEVKEDAKRHKSYDHILSLLDEEEEENEATQDLSSLFCSLQQELSSEYSTVDSLSCATNENDPENAALTTSVEDYASSSSSSLSSSVKEDEEDEKDRVIRHLLEASDDELGIPNMEETSGVVGVEYGEEGFLSGGDGFSNGVDGFPLSDGLWEFEDVTANYYTMLQSPLLM